MCITTSSPPSRAAAGCSDRAWAGLCEPSPACCSCVLSHGGSVKDIWENLSVGCSFSEVTVAPNVECVIHHSEGFGPVSSCISERPRAKHWGLGRPWCSLIVCVNVRAWMCVTEWMSKKSSECSIRVEKPYISTIPFPLCLCTCWSLSFNLQTC